MSGRIIEPWLTKHELAGELKISIRTIERLQPPAMRVGGQNRYRLSEVEAFFNNGSASSADVIRLAAHR
jgi:hypothetical protein